MERVRSYKLLLGEWHLQHEPDSSLETRTAPFLIVPAESRYRNVAALSGTLAALKNGRGGCWPAQLAVSGDRSPSHQQRQCFPALLRPEYALLVHWAGMLQLGRCGWPAVGRGWAGVEAFERWRPEGLLFYVFLKDALRDSPIDKGRVVRTVIDHVLWMVAILVFHHRESLVIQSPADRAERAVVDSIRSLFPVHCSV